MRTKQDVQDCEEKLRYRVLTKCKKCNGTDTDCDCLRQFNFMMSAYEACIPRDFWNIKNEQVTSNKKVFKNTVLKYVANFRTVLTNGYGLVFLGDNGVGKTFFTSYILTKAIHAGYTAYYTTLPQLEYDLTLGFSKGSNDARNRLDWFLTSDFLAIDEVGKEKRNGSKGKNGETYTNVQVERILKQRCDDSMPVVLATNMERSEFGGWYGSTVMSIIDGKYQQIMMEPGDHRKKLAQKMKRDMGYK